MQAQPQTTVTDPGSALAHLFDVPVGSTPRETVLEINKTRLYRYCAAGDGARPPLLIVYSVINRYPILDLLPEKSVVSFFKAHGFDVYMVDWGRASGGDCRLPFEYFSHDVIDLCVQRIRELTGFSKTHVLGYCMGGTMAACYAAMKPEVVQSLALLAAPFDFEKGGLLSKWTRPENLRVDVLVEAHRDLPAEMMASSFSYLNLPAQISKWRTLGKRRGDPAFVRFFLAMEQWANDTVPFPGLFYRTYIKEWYQQNLLVKGRFRLHGRPVELSRITAPLLVVSAMRDNIVPPDCARAVVPLVSSKVRETLEAEGGHIGASVGGKAFKVTWPGIARFLCAHPMDNG